MSDSIYLSPHFTAAEFKCRCGCGICNVSNLLLLRLELLRGKLGHPISINSGCRCEAYNKTVKGEKNSNHITTKQRQCLAVDIKVVAKAEKYNVVKEAFALGFSGIGIGEDFIHLDVRDTWPSIWGY